jgi:hypothetical protein
MSADHRLWRTVVVCKQECSLRVCAQRDFVTTLPPARRPKKRPCVHRVSISLRTGSQISIHDVVERPEEYTLADALDFRAAEIMADDANNSWRYLYVPA